MGIKFGRDYADIITDLTEAMMQIDGHHEFLDMNEEQWGSMTQDEQKECIRTLADDIFFGLGAEPAISIGDSKISYNKIQHVITLEKGEKIIHIVYLV